LIPPPLRPAQATGWYNSRFFALGDYLNHTLARYYRSNDEFSRLRQNLKLTFCPHCKAVGTLILHGCLYGYAEGGDSNKICRGRRIFCSNRKRNHNGCGRTFSIRAATAIRRSRIGAKTFWRFIKLVLSLNNKAQALRDSKAGYTQSAAYILWQRFVGAQSHLRTALISQCPPPKDSLALKLTKEFQKVAQTVAHLEAAFPGDTCPIAAFQHQLQTAFFP
jgi:hypothetical protein